MKLFQGELFKKDRSFLFIILVSFIPLLVFFSTTDLPHTHDGLVHLPRMAAFYKALLDFQFPVRWAGDLNYGYGLPLFNFIYSFPYILSSLFLSLGFGLVTSFKLTLGLSFIFSGIFIYLFSKELFKDQKTTLLVSILYQFAPFRFVEVLMRGSFGEVFAYTFLPLVLYGIVRLSKKISFYNILLTAFATFLLIISHNSVSLLFFGVAFLFGLVFTKGKNRIWSVLSLFLGLTLSAYYWIPAMLDHKYTYGDLFMKDIYLSHFPPLLNFFIPNFTNLKVFNTEGIPVQIGFFHVISLILLICVLFKKPRPFVKKIALFSLFLTLTSLFFMQPVSKIFWEKISFLRQFQFPWRILSIIVFSSSLAGISYLELKLFNKKTVFYVLIMLIIISNIFYYKPLLGIDKIKESYYWNFPLNTTYYGETDVIWSAGSAKSYPEARVEVISGKASIKNFSKKSNVHKFDITAGENVRLVDHTEYFPGWKALVDGQDAPIQFQDPNHRGEITFSVPKGERSVVVKFTETRVRLLSDLLSLLGFIILLSFFLLKKKIFR